MENVLFKLDLLGNFQIMLLKALYLVFFISKAFLKYLLVNFQKLLINKILVL